MRKHTIWLSCMIDLEFKRNAYGFLNLPSYMLHTIVWIRFFALRKKHPFCQKKTHFTWRHNILVMLYLEEICQKFFSSVLISLDEKSCCYSFLVLCTRSSKQLLWQKWTYTEYIKSVSIYSSKNEQILDIIVCTSVWTSKCIGVYEE